MALLKPYHGKESDLNNISVHEGYGYMTTDMDNLFFDLPDEEGTVSRHQVNAYAATVVRSADGADEAGLDDLMGEVVKRYDETIFASGWVAGDDETYSYTYSNTSLVCGKNGDIPPIITYTSNLDEYSEIDSAEATAGVGITFYASKQFENDIGILILDHLR